METIRMCSVSLSLPHTESEFPHSLLHIRRCLEALGGLWLQWVQDTEQDALCTNRVMEDSAHMHGLRPHTLPQLS